MKASTVRPEMKFKIALICLVILFILSTAMAVMTAARFDPNNPAQAHTRR